MTAVILYNEVERTLGGVSLYIKENRMSEKIPNYNYDADEVLNDFKSKFAWPKRDEVQAVVKPGKMPLRLLLCALITAVVGGIAYYMMLPALNVHDTQLYLFLILLVAVFAGSFFLVCRANKKAERLEYVKKKTLIPVVIVAVIAVVMPIPEPSHVSTGNGKRAISYPSNCRWR